LSLQNVKARFTSITTVTFAQKQPKSLPLDTFHGLEIYRPGPRSIHMLLESCFSAGRGGQDRERRAGERKGGKRREVGRKWEKREGFAPVIKIFAGAVFLDFAVVRAMCGSTTNRGGQQGHCCHCFNFLILVFKANQRPIMCRNILSKHFAPYFSVICNHSMKC